jgi:hypothetical protein
MSDKPHFDETTITDAFTEVRSEIGNDDVPADNGAEAAPPTMDSLVEELANATDEKQRVYDQWKELSAKFEADNAVLLQRLQVSRERVSRADMNLRLFSLKVAQETDTRKPHPAVTIKTFKQVTYKPDVAKKWAQEHTPDLLTLNDTAFVRVARAGAVPPEVAQVEEVLQATVSSDLSAYVTHSVEYACPHVGPDEPVCDDCLALLGLGPDGEPLEDGEGE